MQYEVSAEIIVYPDYTMPIMRTEVYIDDDTRVYCYQKGHITRFKEGRFRPLSPDRFLKDLQRLIDRITKKYLYEVKNVGNDIRFCFVGEDWAMCSDGIDYLESNGFLKDDKYTGKKVSRKDLRFAFVNCAWIRTLLKRYK